MATGDWTHLRRRTLGEPADGARAKGSARRGTRSQIAILDKGGPPPACFPGPLPRQHRASLERLRTEYVDLYMLHRDNPDVPVGEFVDALNEHLRSGSMKA